MYNKYLGVNKLESGIISKKTVIEMLDKITNIVRQANSESHSLFGGELARAFYFSYLFECSNEKKYGDIALESFEKVIAHFNAGKAILYGPYLCNGLTGLLYVILLFIKNGLVKEYTKEELEPLVEHLTEAAVIGIKHDNNDFIHGSFGTLYTIAEFAKFSNNYKYLDKLLNQIEYKYFQSQAQWIPCGQDEDSTNFKINISLSHGQSGLLLALFHAYNVLGFQEKAKNYLCRNMDYIVGLKNDTPYDKTYSYFPSIIDTRDDTKIPSGRLAWCYGDLGQVLLLNHASSFFKKRSYADIANDIGIKTTRRLSHEETLILNTHLCHGSAGVAQIYKVLYENTSISEYKGAYYHWIKETIRMCEDELSNPVNKKQTLNLAEGFLGVGLVLMSFLSPKRLDWSSVMLIN